MKVALIYPPTCDPTAPYLSVPTLTGYLREHGVDVLPVDANVEAWDALLRRAPLAELAARVERRLAKLERQPTLGHTEQLLYAALYAASGDAETAPGAIEGAVAALRDRERFYDAEAYDDAVAAVESAQRLVGAAYAPLTVDFTAYRSPFALLSADEIAAGARPARYPFHGWVAGELTERLRRERVDVVGVSLAFPGQLQAGWALAHVLRETLPRAHLIVGGPAATQILLRLEGERLARALRPFDAAILFEGEQALLEHVRALAAGEARRGVFRGALAEDLSRLPPPDFDGLPMNKYFAPEVVLPYDPTRGCYWGACTFCHYGLAETGTARYRERSVDTTLRHLRGLAERHGTRIFYFSQDSVAPKTVLKLARAVRDAGLPWRWGTDMRPERYLTAERCAELAEGGALAMALGVESAAPRVVKLIDKGVAVDDVAGAVANLAAAGVAVEAMCFTDFPTESYREALATLRFVEEHRDALALFICGEFDLVHGAAVARRPADFGIREVWQLDGDELGTGLFYAEARPSKRPAEQEQLDAALADLSRRWLLRHYPWAGALSTAHTLLWYDRFGPDVFKDLADLPPPRARSKRRRKRSPRFDLTAVAAREAEIWRTLIHDRRHVSRAAYHALARKLRS